jgi:hypothetical protein
MVGHMMQLLLMPAARHGRRSAAALERRKSRWLEQGGLEKAEKILAQNTSEQLSIIFYCVNELFFQPPLLLHLQNMRGFSLGPQLVHIFQVSFLATFPVLLQRDAFLFRLHPTFFCRIPSIRLILLDDLTGW